MKIKHKTKEFASKSSYALSYKLNKNNMGERIKKLRMNWGLSQEELSEYLDVSKQCISCIERGRQGMTLDTLTKLSQFFNVPTDYILFGSVKDSTMTPTLNKVLALPDSERKAIETSIDAILDVIQF